MAKTLKIIAVCMGSLFLIFAIAARFQNNIDAAKINIAGAAAWGMLYGLLSVTSIFDGTERRGR